MPTEIFQAGRETIIPGGTNCKSLEDQGKLAAGRTRANSRKGFLGLEPIATKFALFGYTSGEIN